MWAMPDWKKHKYGRRKIYRTFQAMIDQAKAWEDAGYIVGWAYIGIRKWALWHW